MCGGNLNDKANTTDISAFMSNQYTDMTIYCGNLTFNVHKVVVCPQSQVLKELDGEAEVSQVM